MENKIRIRRKELGLSQEELAKKAGVTGRTIQNYELGTRKPQHIEIVSRLATALETTEASVGVVVSSNTTPIADTRLSNVVAGFSRNLSRSETIGLTIPVNTSSRYGLLLSANLVGVSTVMPVF